MTTKANSGMNQSQFPAISCNLLKAREKSRDKVRFVLLLLPTGYKTGARIFKPITKRSNRYRVILFLFAEAKNVFEYQEKREDRHHFSLRARRT